MVTLQNEEYFRWAREQSSLLDDDHASDGSYSPIRPTSSSPGKRPQSGSPRKKVVLSSENVRSLKSLMNFQQRQSLSIRSKSSRHKTGRKSQSTKTMQKLMPSPFEPASLSTVTVTSPPMKDTAQEPNEDAYPFDLTKNSWEFDIESKEEWHQSNLARNDLGHSGSDDIGSEARPLLKSGDRLYSDWVGEWGHFYGVIRKIPGVWLSSLMGWADISAQAIKHALSMIMVMEPFVSRIPIDPATAPPKAQPRRPSRKRKASPILEEIKKKVKKSDGTIYDATNLAVRANGTLEVRLPSRKSYTPSPPTNSTQQPTDKKLAGFQLWSYLKFMLYNTFETKSPHVLELLPLKRLRDLPETWQTRLASGLPSTKTLCALLVYLTGIKAASACGDCVIIQAYSVRGGATLEEANTAASAFSECITLPATASAALREYFGANTCCNRFYRSASHQSVTDIRGLFLASSCSSSSATSSEYPSPSTTLWNAESSSLLSEETVTGTAHTTIRLTKTMMLEHSTLNLRAGSSSTSSEESESSISNSNASSDSISARPVMQNEPTDAAKARSAQKKAAEAKMITAARSQSSSTSLTSATSRSSNPADASDTYITTPDTPTRPTPSKRKKSPATTAVGANKRKASGSAATAAAAAAKATSSPAVYFSSSAVPMMAEWERAPGRISVRTEDGASENIAFSSAYLSKGAVTVTDGVEFRKVELQPGGVEVFRPNDSTRVYSVLQGIVEIDLRGMNFPMGPGGLWVFKTSEACTLTNPFYQGALVHVVSMDCGNDD
ncbi:hypothetical protein B0H63DRAFT_454816 [Podospora didyma]|uniref:Uncharacterized protein n=1 Tax=Podospora didyma TaxID=330526 RepID=A0AAE0N5Y6_9PEZI|nr:hypothetical protein B0H63DRAFT_454816 [Podospora didyma]